MQIADAPPPTQPTPPPAPAEGDHAGSAARDVVCRRLARQVRRFPDLAIGGLDDAGMSARDAGLAHAIYDRCLRRWLTLERLIAEASGRDPEGLEPKVRAALMCGAAQLVLLDRVPDHAAIDESVRWAKANVRPGAGGIVNAVLRRVIELRGTERTYRETWSIEPDEVPLPDGRSLVLTRPAFGLSSGPPGNPPWRDIVSRAASVPRTLLTRWERSFGRDRAIDLARHALVEPPTTLNVRDAEGLEGLPLEPHDAKGARVWAGGPGELSSLIELRNDLWVQDAGTAGTLGILDGIGARTIIDVCAGQGTKTRQLLRLYPEAEIVASEIERPRLEELERVFAGEPRVRVVNVKELMPDLAGWADLVVLDVPCSNTGVLPRRPEARYRASDEAIARLGGVQRQIVADASPLVRSGGYVAYCTCSVEDEENEHQAEWAARQHGWSVIRTARAWPSGLPGESASGYRDASFSALLQT